MRTVLYLGTRGCPPTLEDALDGYHDPLAILVPADARLLGPRVSGPSVRGGLEEIARILADRALDDAIEIAKREDKELADVFGQGPPDPSERLSARVLEGDLVDGLASVLEAHPDVETLYVARDALDVLDGVSIRPSDALEGRGVELVAR